MTIEEQAQILSEAVVETRAARHHYQDDIKEEERRMRTEDEGKSSGVAKAGLTTGIIRTALGALAGGGNGLLGGLEFSMLGKRFTVEQSDFESIIN